VTSKTYLALLLEFDSGDIPLASCCEKYFGMEYKKAARLARKQNLPVPAYRCGSQKSPWMISADKLAEFVDKKKAEAEAHWRKMNGDAA
jgi:hypothetical protein